MPASGTILNIFIISKSGSLVYEYEAFNNSNVSGTSASGSSLAPNVVESEIVCRSLPIDVKLQYATSRVHLTFGARDGVEIGHHLSKVNGIPLSAENASILQDGRRVQDVIEDDASYPIRLAFVRPKLTANDKIVLASTFYPLFALAVQLSPVSSSSGIQSIQAESFTVFCRQTLTGIKFVVVADMAMSRTLTTWTSVVSIDQLIDRLYELYCHFGLKNPFHALEMPIRSHAFDRHLQSAVAQVERGLPLT